MAEGGVVSSILNFANDVGKYAKTASDVFNVYAGFRNMQNASDMSELSEEQMKWAADKAKDVWEKGGGKDVIYKQNQGKISDLDVYNDPANVALRQKIASGDYQTGALQSQVGLDMLTAAQPNLARLAGDSTKLQADLAYQQSQYLPKLVSQEYDIAGAELDAKGRYLPGILDKQYTNAGNTLDAQSEDILRYRQSGDIMDKFYDESRKGLDLNTEMGRAGAAVENAFARSDSENARNLARRGISMDSGQALSQAQQSAINKALAKAGARTNAWRTANETNYNRLGNAVNVRQGAAPAGANTPQGGTNFGGNIVQTSLPTTNRAGLTAPTSGQSVNSLGIMGQAGETSRQLAQSSANAANQAWKEVGYSANRN